MGCHDSGRAPPGLAVSASCASFLLPAPVSFRSRRRRVPGQHPLSRVSHVRARLRLRRRGFARLIARASQAQGALLLSVPRGFFRAGAKPETKRPPDAASSCLILPWFFQGQALFRNYFSISRTHPASRQIMSRPAAGRAGTAPGRRLRAAAPRSSRGIGPGARLPAGCAKRGAPRPGMGRRRSWTDSGAHRIVLSQLYECYRPRGLLQSSALCTMGCAVPLAIGRKLAEPERTVVATVGDAGLEMFLGELATLRDLKLAIPITVFVDTQLGPIELKQRGSQLQPRGGLRSHRLPRRRKSARRRRCAGSRPGGPCPGDRGGLVPRPLHDPRRRDRPTGL